MNSQFQPAGPKTSAPGDRPATPVSVVMCTYNGDRFLRPAIESILHQTFSDFELIVVDDASTDSTPSILAEIKEEDDRLIDVTNQHNLGIAASTNKGLALARGQYIALQDHDDISLPHRLQTQLAYLNSHPGIALLGSAATLIDENGIVCGDCAEPTDDIEIKWESLFRCPIRHTSVMMRRSVMSEIGGYSSDPTLKVASDYDLLSRIVMHHPVANLNERLVMWRRHPGAASITHDQQQLRAGDLTSLRNIRALILKDDLTGSESNQQYRMEGSRAFLCTPAGQLPSLPPEQIISGLRFLGDLLETFYRTYDFSSSAAQRLRKHLNWIWGKHAVALAVRSPWDWGSRVRMSILGIRCVGGWLG